MPKEFLVFQHTPWEGPGNLLLRSANKHKTTLDIIRLWKETIPPMTNYDGLLVLGGTPNIHQDDKFQFLKEEKLAIKEWITADRPYLGICLGHQLLADTLGAKIGNNYCKSIGFIDGYLTRKGKVHPLFSQLPKSIPLFKWHSQAIVPPVPRNFAILATSAECQIESFSIKTRPHIIGVQFDNNMADLDGIKIFLDNNPDWIRTHACKYINSEAMLAAADSYNNTLEKQYDIIFSNFIGLT